MIIRLLFDVNIKNSAIQIVRAQCVDRKLNYSQIADLYRLIKVKPDILEAYSVF